MNSVKIINVTAVTALAFRDQLLEFGLKQHEDFEWLYHPPYYDNFADHDNQSKYVEFKFRDPALATFFQLKWA